MDALANVHGPTQMIATGVLMARLFRDSHFVRVIVVDGGRERPTKSCHDFTIAWHDSIRVCHAFAKSWHDFLKSWHDFLETWHDFVKSWHKNVNGSETPRLALS